MSMMSVRQIPGPSGMLSRFLYRFRDRLARPAGKALLLEHVLGLMSMVQRNNVEATALDQVLETAS
ncbi:MAG: hypothetical protein RLZZ436_274 [Planctomycetota bacterium]